MRITNAERQSHEAVHFFEDPQSGVEAVIAIHSTALGPAAGGCRLWAYPDRDAGIRDALRLSEAMSYKNALAGLPFGGGKAVVMLPEGSARLDRDRIFDRFGSCVERLGGRYVTAEDVGSGVTDMQTVARRTRHVAGLPSENGGAGGDPSPWTALGVFLSIEAAVVHRLDRSLGGVRVGVQGLGHVGFELCRKLHAAGARLLVSDVDPERVAAAREQFGAESVAPANMLEAPMEVFAPCAMGGVLTRTSVARLQAEIVCGAANNQLESEAQGRELAECGILYAPDYLVNAGGIISVACEHLGEARASVEHRVAQIPHRLRRLLQRSEEEHRPMNELADETARSLIAERSQALVA